jgi:hypothetical protein
MCTNVRTTLKSLERGSCFESPVFYKVPKAGTNVGLCFGRRRISLGSIFGTALGTLFFTGSPKQSQKSIPAKKASSQSRDLRWSLLWRTVFLQGSPKQDPPFRIFVVVAILALIVEVAGGTSCVVKLTFGCAATMARGRAGKGAGRASSPKTPKAAASPKASAQPVHGATKTIGVALPSCGQTQCASAVLRQNLC